MKKLIIMVMAMSLFSIFFGCAGLQLSRTVDENNIFISTGKPKIRIKINKSLQYMEQRSSSQSARSYSGGEAGTNEKREFFIFDDNNQNKRLIFAITYFTSSRWYYVSEKMDMDGVVDYGKMTLGGMEYRYTTKVETNADSAYFVKTLLRRVGTRNNCRFLIVYREAIVGDTDGNRMKQFNENFLNAFEIL